MKFSHVRLALIAVLLAALPPLAAAQSTVTVTQVGLSFSPAAVTIQEGDTVIWNWSGGFHTVTSGTGSADADAGMLFDSPLTAASPTFSFTFATAGDYDYFCAPHEGLGMVAVVHVLPAPPTPLLYAGLDHTALGAATLADDGAGTLTISNIGSSGEDGVSIDLGSTPEGFTAETVLDPAAPLGATSMWDLYGNLDGGPEQLLSTTGMVRTAEGFAVHADFSPLGSATFTATLLDAAGVVVHTQSGLNIGDVIILTPTGTWGFTCGTKWSSTGETGSWWNVHLGDISLFFEDKAIYVGQSILLEPDSHPTEVVQPTALDWRLSGMPSFDIQGESLTVFDNEHVAQGQARFEADGGTLTVSNIGSSGLDGVSQVLPPNTVEDCIIWDIQAGGGSGGSLSLHMMGGLGGLGGIPGPLGSVHYQEAGSVFQVTADFSPLGSTSTTVQVWDGAALAAEFTGQTGILAEIPAEGNTKEPIIDIDSVAFNDKFGTSKSIIAGPAGESFIGDKLTLIPEGASGAVDDLQSVVILCNQIDIVILDEILNVSVTAVDDLPDAAGLSMIGPSPNPFNPLTAISFELARDGAVDLEVLDLRGRLVATLLSGAERGAGSHRVVWDGSNEQGTAVSSGTYLFRVRFGGDARVVKGVLVR